MGVCYYAICETCTVATDLNKPLIVHLCQEPGESLEQMALREAAEALSECRIDELKRILADWAQLLGFYQLHPRHDVAVVDENDVRLLRLENEDNYQPVLGLLRGKYKLI